MAAMANAYYFAADATALRALSNSRASYLPLTHLDK